MIPSADVGCKPMLGSHPLLFAKSSSLKDGIEMSAQSLLKSLLSADRVFIEQRPETGNIEGKRGTFLR
jgi:hypothetical protein